MADLRPLLFGGSDWYERLEEPSKDEPSAWYVAKSPEGRWTTELLNVAAQFARDHGLVEHYRKRFAGLRALDLTVTRANAERRHVSFPIWEIAHELVVARYLECVLGWKYSRHEPPGNKTRVGDWEFVTKRGQVVFVEVKSVAEIEVYGTTGAYSKSIPFEQLRNVVKGAYKQLPDDDRGTLVVLCGRDKLNSSFGIMHSDVFQTLFGQYVIRFKPFEPDSEFIGGPTFHDTLINGTKHRRLGCVAGMRLTGLDDPVVDWHAIDNPYAYPQHRIADADLAAAHRFMVDVNRLGREFDGFTREQTWQHMASPPGTSDS